MEEDKKGGVIVVSAASGTRTTSLIKALLENRSDIRVAISHTTRAPRGEEKDGVDYHFVSQETFLDMVGQGKFLEFAEVHGHYYGTGVDEVAQLTASGVDVILEIDVQGAMQVRQQIPQAALVFVVPPSMEVLERRLRGRDTDSPETIKLRMRNALRELEQACEYDYVIENDSFDEAKEALRSVVVAERCRRSSNEGLIQRLLGEGQSYRG